MIELSEVVDKSCVILNRTNDGEDLDPSHLYLIQCAVNRDLTSHGKKAFAELYNQVVSEEGYKRPWLHGVEHLTIDHAGYVYWKGHYVEHYSHYTMENVNLENLSRKIGKWCPILEANGIAVSSWSVSWANDEVEQALYNDMEVNEYSEAVL